MNAVRRIDVAVGQLEIPQSVTAAGFRAARGRGAATVLNPAPAAAISADLLRVTDWLIPNEVEFGALSRTSEDPSDRAMIEFAARTGTRLVITLGAPAAPPLLA